MSENTKDCHLAVVIEGGQVQSIVTDCPERFVKTNFLVIDYDEEDYDEADHIPVLQGDGTVSTAFADLWPLEETAIDLKGVVHAIAELN
ncbi:MAG TPA: hypothetical protein EYP90_01595 [Chromatiaceae bacterium]|nr:hypothetical protein [Chromatiaceae bacterium]